MVGWSNGLFGEALRFPPWPTHMPAGLYFGSISGRNYRIESCNSVRWRTCVLILDLLLDATSLAWGFRSQTGLFCGRAFSLFFTSTARGGKDRSVVKAQKSRAKETVLAATNLKVITKSNLYRVGAASAVALHATIRM